MPEAKQSHEIEAISFLKRARQFYKTAELAFEPEALLNMPLYFPYVHVLELAFKAFLRSHNVPTHQLKKGKGHKLAQLYEDCRRCGLVIGPSDRTDIGNVVNLLEKANEDQGLRYFNADLKALPTLAWTREVVQKLISTVGLHLGDTTEETAGPPVKFIFVLDKPRAKS
jgi:hypothetical protein